MKKLLVLALVLVVSTMASATSIWLEVDAGSTVAAGQTVTINLVSDLTTNAFYFDGVVESSSVDADSQALNTVNMGGSVSGISINLSNPDSDGPYIDNYQGALFGVTGGYDDPGEGAGNVIMSFNYAISGSWDGSSFWVAPLASGQTYVYDGDSFEVGQSYGDIGEAGRIDVAGVELVVPEPITVALLGLGGLFIRRRK